MEGNIAMIKRLGITVVLLCAAAGAQVYVAGPQLIVAYTSSPVGLGCSPTQIAVYNGAVYPCQSGSFVATAGGGGNVSGSGSSALNSGTCFNNTNATGIKDCGAMIYPDSHTWSGENTAASSTDLSIKSNGNYVASVDGTLPGMWLMGSPVDSTSAGVSVGLNPLLIGQAPNAVPITSGKNETGQSVILAGGAVNGAIVSNGNVVPGDVQVLTSGRLTSGTAPTSFNPACWGGPDNVGNTGHNTLQVCQSTAQANYQAGVVLPSTGAYASTVGQTFYADMMGKVTVNSIGSQTWTAGDNLCTDTANVGDFIDGGTNPCLCPSTRMGSITTTSTGFVHIVQYVPSAACSSEIPVYFNQFAPTNVSLGSTTMLAAPVSGATYLVWVDGVATDGGTGCTGTGSVSFTLGWQQYAYGSALSATPTQLLQGFGANTVVATTLSLPTTAGGATTANEFHGVPYQIETASGTAVTILTTYTAGASCTVGENYSFTARMVRVH